MAVAVLNRSAAGAAAVAALALGAGMGIPACGAAQQRPTPNTLTRDTAAPAPRATIGDVAWLAGAWEAEAFGGVAEEVWNPPSAGAMVGMYKLRRADSVVFYELMLIVEQARSLSLLLKHFTPSLTGWEEKDEVVAFPLVRLDPNAVHFEGLTFVRLHPDTLRVFLRMRHADGTASEQTFVYRRVRGR
ncbi:MAG: DUF6265 family protein [Gemmatimonadota bacterium]|nr:DUF6265 family protein [Gemmatimonadota bacterium]